MCAGSVLFVMWPFASLIQAAHKDELDHVVAELSAKRVSDIDSLAGQHAAQVRALDEELATRAVALSEREGEVKRLRSILEDSREGLGSASKQITDLETELSAVKKELAQNRGLLGRRDTECEALKVCMYVCMYTPYTLPYSQCECVFVCCACVV